MIFGDLFDAMQGRFDPRRSMEELRKEYRRSDYYNFVVTDVANFLEPYADQIDLITDGNHELAVLKNANSSLISCLVHELNKGSRNIIHGGYGGWVHFMLDLNGASQRINLKYFHGSGGEAPVTRGAIQTNRQAVFLPDADIVVNGHNHQNYHIPIARERISQRGKQYMDLQHHIRIPGYKQEYGDGSRGWSVTSGNVPKPIGAVWMRMWFKGNANFPRNNNGKVMLQFIPDVVGPEPVSLDIETSDLFEGKVYPQDNEGE